MPNVAFGPPNPSNLSMVVALCGRFLKREGIQAALVPDVSSAALQSFNSIQAAGVFTGIALLASSKFTSD